MSTRATATQKQVQVIVKEVVAAKTPAEQIAEIPKLTDAPLNVKPLPEVRPAVRPLRRRAQAYCKDLEMP